MSVLELVAPRISSVPEYVASTGAEAVELAASCGLELDPWQATVLDAALGERADGSWAAAEIGVVLPRQNGKDAILEARELAGLFLLKEPLLIHSAHLFSTAREHFSRLLGRIESNPDLVKRVKRVSRSHGDEGIEIKREYGGASIRFFTRNKGSARGFSCDCLLLNEAMFLPEEAFGAMLPTLSARPDPQVWYAGSPVDQLVHEHGIVLARVRERGISSQPGSRLAYFEYSVDASDPDDVTDEQAASPEVWADANPGMAVGRITDERIESERHAMDARTFAVERLGVGDWPATSPTSGGVIDLDAWLALKDPASEIVGDPVFAFDVTPDRSRSAIGVAGFRPDGRLHVEVVKHETGTKWVVPEIAGMVERNDPLAVVCAGRSPAAALLTECEEAGLKVTALSDGEHADATGALFDRVEQDTLRHLGSGELLSAVKGATTRPLGDGGWAWSRKNSAVDISPLVSVTLAAFLARDDGGGIHIF